MQVKWWWFYDECHVLGGKHNIIRPKPTSRVLIEGGGSALCFIMVSSSIFSPGTHVVSSSTPRRHPPSSTRGEASFITFVFVCRPLLYQNVFKSAIFLLCQYFMFTLTLHDKQGFDINKNIEHHSYTWHQTQSEDLCMQPITRLTCKKYYL